MSALFSLLLVAISLMPIAALVLALRASGQAKRNAERLRRAEDHISRLEAAMGPQPEPPRPTKPAAPEAASDAQVEEPEDDTSSKEPPSEPLPSTAAIEPSFEERLGTKWAVYVGGLALAIGGILLVRYTIEAGLIGPGARIVLGLLFSGFLLAAGEWFRRRDIELGVNENFAAHIPSVLTAAGTVAAFATVYASYALYHFISNGPAFVALGLIGVVTILGAAFHGPALAALGLVGANVTPILVSSQTPNPWALVIFLAVVSAAALMLGRLRRWSWVVWANIACIAAWGIGLTTKNFSGLNVFWANPTFAHIIVQTALVAVALAFLPYFRETDDDTETDGVAVAALAGLAGLFVFAHHVVPFQYGHWITVALAMIVLLAATGLANAPVAASTILAGALITTTLFIWSNATGGIEPRFPESLFGGLPDNVFAFLYFTAASTLGLTAVTAYKLNRGSALAFQPTLFYSIAMSVPVLLALSLAYVRVTHFGYSLPFGCAGAVLAGGFVWLADFFDRQGRDEDNRAAHLVASVAALAAIAALSIAFITYLDRGYLTVAFAITAFGAAVVAIRRDLPIMRYVLVPLGLVVLGRLIWDPTIVGRHIGGWPIFNWLLVGYGVPAASFAGAAWLLRKRGVNDVTVQFSEAIALLFATMLVFFEIRHFLHDGDILAKTTGHVEMGLFAITTLGFSFAISRLFRGTDNHVFQSARVAFAATTGLIAVFGLATTQNPYFSGEAVAGPLLLSSLLPAYLLPGLFALYVARVVRDEVQNQDYALFAASLGLALVFAYVTLEVRHLFHGRNIGMSVRTTDVEMWAYNIAWLALAIVFLGYGLIRQSLPARIASACLLTATVLKIGLLDLSGLTGFWRAFSFICLGAVLIGIGLVYQRLIFTKPITKT